MLYSPPGFAVGCLHDLHEQYPGVQEAGQGAVPQVPATSLSDGRRGSAPLSDRDALSASLAWLHSAGSGPVCEPTLDPFVNQYVDPLLMLWIGFLPLH